MKEEYDWFVLVPLDKLWKDNDYKGRYMVFRTVELKDELENLSNDNIKSIEMKCKFVYRSNEWRERLEKIY